MALKRFGFIVTGSGLDPAIHRLEMRSPTFTMVAVGIPRAEDAPAVARELVAEGVELLELCGGFGPLGAARVLEAIDGAVPVGAVGYGPESIDALYRLFAPAERQVC
ncbi:MAG: hypothetical protein HOW73_19600 [Polyangiaceae bacterium]|nr:hypothetical protein [Polyangiaceae bacterium]